MHRYFLEVAYKGTNYSGFQIQHNANTIQQEVEKALAVLFRRPFALTGASRTDAGVHALQNFFHFDSEIIIDQKSLYKLNAILPPDITAKKIYNVNNESHCRFDVVSREYKYFIYRKKNPFLRDIAYYYPYKLDIEVLQQVAKLVKEYNDFSSFSKRKTQVKTFSCNLSKSVWYFENDCLIYNIVSNRFLRGMVRALVATMLKAAQHTLSIAEFRQMLVNKNGGRADFSAPSHGLFLIKINFGENILNYLQNNINSYNA